MLKYTTEQILSLQARVREVNTSIDKLNVQKQIYEADIDKLLKECKVSTIEELESKVTELENSLNIQFTELENALAKVEPQINSIKAMYP